ncbi:MAG: hypothetical protein KGR26_14520, partial [Cyanobacteria bacterium REEB65]|nr:hypothetical protein [Cyanobacteria bacterium REEB65]
MTRAIGERRAAANVALAMLLGILGGCGGAPRLASLASPPLQAPSAPQIVPPPADTRDIVPGE